jgi:hypothetical protein
MSLKSSFLTGSWAKLDEASMQRQSTARQRNIFLLRFFMRVRARFSDYCGGAREALTSLPE